MQANQAAANAQIAQAQAQAPAQTPLLEGSNAKGPVPLERRVSDIDDKYMGQKLPVRLARGPVSPRRITDVICCLVFPLVLIAFLVIGIIYSSSTKVKNLTKPQDSKGNVCGIDAAVKDYPNLYFYSMDRPYKSACIKTCPQFDYNQIKYNSTGGSTNYIQPLYFENYSSVVNAPWVSTNATTGQRNSFDYNPNAAQGYYTRDQWETYLKRFSVDCYPNSDVTTCGQNEAKGYFLYDSRPNYLGICTPLSPDLVSKASKIGNLSGNWSQDLTTGKWMIVIAVILAFILSLVFIWLTSYCIEWIIWIQAIVAVSVLAILFVVLCFFAYGDNSSLLANRNISSSTIQWYQSLQAYRIWFMIFSFFILWLLIWLVSYLIINRHKINNSSKVLRVSSVLTLVRKPPAAEESIRALHRYHFLRSHRRGLLRRSLLPRQRLLCWNSFQSNQRRTFQEVQHWSARMVRCHLFVHRMDLDLSVPVPSWKLHHLCYDLWKVLPIWWWCLRSHLPHAHLPHGNCCMVFHLHSSFDNLPTLLWMDIRLDIKDRKRGRRGKLAPKRAFVRLHLHQMALQEILHENRSMGLSSELSGIVQLLSSNERSLLSEGVLFNHPGWHWTSQLALQDHRCSCDRIPQHLHCLHGLHILAILPAVSHQLTVPYCRNLAC